MFLTFCWEAALWNNAMALVILNMPAMPWHWLFTAEHPDAKQRFPFKGKSHYENPEEKVSLACRVHSSFLLLLNKLLVTSKNRTKMKKQGQKCCQRHFILHSPLRPAQQPSPGANPGQERRGMKPRSEGSVRDLGWGDQSRDRLKNLVSFLSPGPGETVRPQKSVNNCTLCCTGIWACLPIPYAASLPMLMFFSPLPPLWTRTSRICVLGVLSHGVFSWRLSSDLG